MFCSARRSRSQVEERSRPTDLGAAEAPARPRGEQARRAQGWPGQPSCVGVDRPSHRPVSSERETPQNRAVHGRASHRWMLDHARAGRLRQRLAFTSILPHGRRQASVLCRIACPDGTCAGVGARAARGEPDQDWHDHTRHLRIHHRVRRERTRPSRPPPRSRAWSPAVRTGATPACRGATPPPSSVDALRSPLPRWPTRTYDSTCHEQWRRRSASTRAWPGSFAGRCDSLHRMSWLPTGASHSSTSPLLAGGARSPTTRSG